MIKRTEGDFKKLEYSGTGLSSGKAVSIDSSGNAAICGNLDSPFKPCIGFVRHLESDYAIVQVSGELQMSSTVSGTEYWLSSSGNITSTLPSSGIIQKVGIGLPNNKLLVKIDTDIISL